MGVLFVSDDVEHLDQGIAAGAAGYASSPARGSFYSLKCAGSGRKCENRSRKPSSVTRPRGTQPPEWFPKRHRYIPDNTRRLEIPPVAGTTRLLKILRTTAFSFLFLVSPSTKLMPREESGASPRWLCNLYSGSLIGLLQMSRVIEAYSLAAVTMSAIFTLVSSAEAMTSVAPGWVYPVGKP